jgi:hypothetical protein
LSNIQALAIGYDKTFAMPTDRKGGPITVTLSAVENDGRVRTRTMQVLVLGS